jgi:sugar O-acyltransferase (sialic acid O-acetyltransferase NeuD family)
MTAPESNRMDCILIGAGGHAKAVAEAATATIGDIVAYVDPQAADWLNARQIADDARVAAGDQAIIIGLGGVTTAQLRNRLKLFESYLDRGHRAPVVVHPQAHVSSAAHLESGVIVLAGAIVQPGAILARGVIVNTRAVVEHDCTVGAGSHIAPGAIVLGACNIGSCVVVGAGAVVLPGVTIDDEKLVPALTRQSTPT